MYIYEIIKPGTWLNNNDRDWCRETEGILTNLEEQFYEANLALNLFLHAVKEIRQGDTREQWEADSRHRYEIRKEVESAFKTINELSAYDDVDLVIEIRFKREQWNAGRMPAEFRRKQAFLHARAFLYAVDAFEHFLCVLKDQPGVPAQIPGLHQRLATEFPHLRGDNKPSQPVADSPAEPSTGEQLQALKPPSLEDSLRQSDAGLPAIHGLNGSRYANTLANGSYREVVSTDSMTTLQAIFQAVLDAFSWRGPKVHLPGI